MNFKKAVLAAASLFAMASTASAAPSVLTFEDLLVGPIGGGLIAAGPAAGHYGLDDPFGNGAEFFRPPTTYHGFTFAVSPIGPDSTPVAGPAGSWFYTRLPASSFVLSKSGAVSAATEGICAPNLAGNCTDAEPFNPLKPSLAITSATPFRFDGAWFASQSTNTPISYVGKLAGVEVLNTIATPRVLNSVVPFEGSVFVASNYGFLIDELYIVSRQGQFGMDDFTYDTVPIPEPGTYGLMLAGLAGVAVAARRRAKKA